MHSTFWHVPYMSSPVLNPFAERMACEPRGPLFSVDEIHQTELDALVAAFGPLEEGVLPRPSVRSGPAQILISTAPGSGKTHLVSRLFQELRGRATLVYVRAFQNSGAVFQSLALALVREMHFPDGANIGVWNPDLTTQLDDLAHCVLANTVADMVASGKGIRAEEADTEEVVSRLRGDPLAAFDRGNPGENWAGWMREHFERLLPLFEERIRLRGLLIDSPGAWLRILYAYAFNPAKPALRRACLDWMVAIPLENEDTAFLGLAEEEIVRPEIDPEEANRLCEKRLAELCQLACYFRPFVFCFEQTEFYGRQPALARAFGGVIEKLASWPNQLSVIGSSGELWEERIATHFTEGVSAGLATPMRLAGVTREQAEALAGLRLKTGGSSPERAATFLDENWLSGLFPSPDSQMSAGTFLEQCSARWAKPPEPKATLEELYGERRNKLLALPKRRMFEPDTLEWLIEEASRGQEQVAVERVNGKYFTLRWETPKRVCYFGFSAGSNWRQWGAIARAAIMKGKDSSRPAKAVFFRTPEQKPVPGTTWQIANEINAAKTRYLHIVSLTNVQIAELYAAKDLFADAVQGGIPYSGEEVLGFLDGHLAPWWERLSGPATEAESQTVLRLAGNGSALRDLPGRVRRLVEGERRISLADAISNLGEGLSDEDVLVACGVSAEIAIVWEQRATLLLWRGEPKVEEPS